MGYKMKGFSGFKPSPVKISDSELVDTVKSLGEVQNKFIEKGFVTATKGLTSKIDKKITGKKKKQFNVDDYQLEEGQTSGDGSVTGIGDHKDFSKMSKPEDMFGNLDADGFTKTT